MAGQHGGYRAPADPAPVSGPGALARRTDGGPGDKQPIRVAAGGAYGDRQAMESLQSAAPLPEESGAPPAPPYGGPPVTPLTEATQRPDEPITAGAPGGPGPGLDALGLDSQQSQRQAANFEIARKYLPLIEPYANSPDVPDEVRLLVRYLKNV